MKKVIHSWKVEFLISSRKIWIWIAFLLPFYPLYSIFINSITRFDPGRALTSSAFIFQAGIFIFLILGYEIVRREENSSSKEVFISLPNGITNKYLGKIMLIITYVIIFIVIALALLFVLFYLNRIPIDFYIDSAYYMVLYWGIPFLVAAFIGMNMGIFFNSRGVYIVLALLGLALGPLNIGIFDNISIILHTDLTNVSQFLNLGQTDPQTPYDPSYGLPMEKTRWLQKLWWLLLLITITIIHLFFNLKWKMILSTIMVLILVVSLAEILDQFSTIRATNHEKQSFAKYDMDYYKNYRHPAKNNDSINFKVNSYDIDLHVSSKINSVVKMNIIPGEKGNSLSFSLYHDFKIEKVIDEQQNELKFQQIGDSVTIMTPYIMNTNDPVIITINYEGTSSPYYFANEQAIMLPSYFTWYPVPGKIPSMKAESFYVTRYALYPSYKVKYNLHYTGSLTAYTNVNQLSSNEWEGVSDSGISLFAGPMKKLDIEGYTIVYPVSMFNMIDEVPKFIKQSNIILGNIQRDFGIEKITVPKEIFFASVPSESQLYSSNYWLMNNHMIVAINQMYNEGQLLDLQNEAIDSLLSSMLKETNSMNQNDEIKSIFISGYNYWYNKRFPSKHEYEQGKTPSLHYLLDYYSTTLENKKVAQVIKNIIELLDSKTNNQTVESFFRQWLLVLKQSKAMTFDHIQLMIEEMR
ncbi:hypothetical protein AZ66_15670 [Paenibacillus sp. E194]|uniref:ABC transporter permease n=1 Tax=Paenibacillus sp. E194 TaxID=1458845 RepID=UPI0005C93EF8|nr:ABC transporter permease [Paenibacillus sp. E194]KJB86987.1 hypothetical protein AZ66_15670 [Paenibacillus sp. E194]